MTTHSINLHKYVSELILYKSKFDKEEGNFHLDFNDIDRETLLHICMLCLKENDMHLENIFCNDLDNISSSLLKFLENSDFFDKKYAKEKLLEAIEDDVIAEYKEKIKYIIDEELEIINSYSSEFDDEEYLYYKK